MRNQSDGMTKNSTASFQVKEGESAIVLDSYVDHSSIERHRKRIFQGRSKSIRTRRNNQKVQSSFVPNSTSNIQLNNPKLMQKVEQMQEQISRLTELLQQKQKREAEEQRKINDIINIKNKEVRSYTSKIEELTREVDSKNRELESCRLQIQKLIRCNRIIHQTDQLSELIEQENGKSLTSFMVDTHNRSSLGGNWFRPKAASLSPSPEKSTNDPKRILIINDNGVPVTRPINDFLSPFSVAEIVQEQKAKPWEPTGHHNRQRRASPLKDNYNYNSTGPSTFNNRQKIVVRPVTSVGAIVNTFY